MNPDRAGDALLAVGWVRGAAGDRAGGLDDLDRARAVSHNMKEDVHRNTFLYLVVLAQLDLGDRDAAATTVGLMRQGIEAISEGWDRTLASSPLIQALVALDDIDGAFRLADEAGVSAPYNRGTLLGTIARAVSEPSAWSYRPSRKPFSPEERKDRLPILARVAKAAEEHPFVEDRPYLALAEAWANLGDFQEALKAARSYGRGRCDTRSPST